MKNPKPPVITVDGPSGTGKGTLAMMLANKLNWHYLDSGAIYRVVGWDADHQGVSLDDEAALVALVQAMDLKMENTEHSVRIICNGHDVSEAIRTSEGGQLASKVARHPGVRKALVTLQENQRREPGLVTDGRDMGTVIFSDATLKIFLEASAEIRAKRRVLQLKRKGIDANLRTVSDAIIERDRRDIDRSCSPLVPADDAIVIDTSEMSIDEVFEHCLSLVHN